MEKGTTSHRIVLILMSLTVAVLMTSCQALSPSRMSGTSAGQQVCAADTPSESITDQNVSPQFFGMHVNDPVDLSTLSVPVGTIRLWDSYTDWMSLCPRSATTCDWSILDTYLDYAASNGIDVIYTFGRVPVWENPSGPNYQHLWATNVANTADWNEFVQAIVHHSRGRIKYWEIWNEPNISAFWSGTNAQLIALAQSAYGIIKAADPCSKILLPPTSDPNWTNNYLSAGGGQYADILTFHGYASGTPEDYIPMISAFQSVFVTNGYSAKPVWDTEGNWVDGNPGYTHNPSQDASWVARSLVLHASMGISRFMWYGWDYCNNSPCFANLWTPEIGIRTPGAAYRTTAHWLQGASIGPCLNPSGTIWVCPLFRPTGTSEIIWNSRSTSSTYQVDSQYVQYRSLLSDAVYPIDGNTVVLGHQPILVETKSHFLRPDVPQF